MTYTIEIKDLQFTPSELAIKVGDSVQWKNLDRLRHSARRDDAPEFDTGLLAQNQVSKPVTFDAASPAGGFDYFCEPHPQMTGAIKVTA
jgi:plastocyanin